VDADRALADPAAPPEEKLLLERAAAARDYALRELGLRRTRNYTSLVRIEGDCLAYVVQACAELSFDRHLWTYPLVGKLPYRGYFDREEARAEAARLRERGYDTIARPVDSFSTLGWLKDPLFSFMASYSEAEIAELVIHEMTHATVFLKGSSPGHEQFNEELATFLGREASLRFLEGRHGPDSPELAEARAARADAEAFAAFLRGTATALEGVYSSEAAEGEKRRLKAAVIAERAREFESLRGELFSEGRYRGFDMAGINNAWLDLYRLYEGEPELYAEYLDARCGGDLRRFVESMSRIAKIGGDPKAAMRAAIASGDGATL